MNPPAKLPVAHVRRRLYEIPEGQTVYAGRWALLVDDDLGCWLDPTSYVGTRTHEHTLRISVRADGFHVWLPAEYGWTPGVAGRQPHKFLPVAAIYEADPA